MTSFRDPTQARLRPLLNLIFASRWLQLSLYLGLIVKPSSRDSTSSPTPTSRSG